MISFNATGNCEVYTSIHECGAVGSFFYKSEKVCTKVQSGILDTLAVFQALRVLCYSSFVDFLQRVEKTSDALILSASSSPSSSPSFLLLPSFFLSRFPICVTGVT